VLVSGGADSIRENAGVGGHRDPLNLSETALLIADFVNARTRTTSCDIVEKFAVDRKAASQYLGRLWLGGFIGKRARGLFEPAKSSPTPGEHSEDTGDSERTEDSVDTVGSDGAEGIERVEDSHEPGDGNSDDIDESDDSGDTVDTGKPEDTELVDREDVLPGDFVDIAGTHDSALTDDSEDSDDTGQSVDRDDAGDREDSEDGSASAELTSGLQAVEARQDNPKVRTAGRCPDCGSELGKSTGKCVECILVRARMLCADQAVAAS
jgi:hypothetical protein